MRVDLITGFLGSGKTTFIRRYLAYLKSQGERVHIIENEFGSVGVDARLLREEDCTIDDLSGCCMCCTGRDKFMAMLINSATEGCDRVLVEPSGIYDVDEFFSVMSADAVKAHCEIGSILTIVDAGMDEKHLTKESGYLMYAQLLAAGTVIVSKTQLYPEGTAEETIKRLNRLIEEDGGGRVLKDTPAEDHPGDVCKKEWDAFTPEDFERFNMSGYRHPAHARHKMAHQEIFMSMMLAGRCAGEEDLEERIRRLFEDPSRGNVLRVKGHIRDLEGNWYEVNSTPQKGEIRPVSDIRRGLLVVIGQNLDEPAIQAAFLPRK